MWKDGTVMWVGWPGMQQMGEGWEDSQPSHSEAADGRGGREKIAVGAQ
ncbi:hypothetical protein TIFTF001_049308 [Ficus carica]|uniref:Uncharacterized protein n=1 Tax=Ficus carica TaxID=3494 RepID=A0AA87ZLZ7_FICCA|nr:hypothetical protein TIFTF001_049308 [Ficus carica]